MKETGKKVLVLFSGGQDSTTCPVFDRKRKLKTLSIP